MTTPGRKINLGDTLRWCYIVQSRLKPRCTLKKMTHKSKCNVLMGPGIIALLMVGCGCPQEDLDPPEGTWACTTQWSHERNGVNVPRSVEQQITCANHAMTTTGVVSIGTAQWSEKKEGTCYASGDELYGTWTSCETVPKNDAARQFEQERLGGESLGDATRPADPQYRVRVTSRTETTLEAVNEEGRVISCTRL